MPTATFLIAGPRGEDGAPRYYEVVRDPRTQQPRAFRPALTEHERQALVPLVAAVANDGLDTYGLSPSQQAAVRRALGKLAAV